MDPISEQYRIGQSFQLCSITQLGFAPREGYQFRYWIDSSGRTYGDGETVTVNDTSVSISAIWEFNEIVPTGEIDYNSIAQDNQGADIWWKGQES